MGFRIEVSSDGVTWTDTGERDDAYFSALRLSRRRAVERQRWERIWNEEQDMVVVIVSPDGMPRGNDIFRSPGLG